MIKSTRLSEDCTRLIENNDLKLLGFKIFDSHSDTLKACFTTRLGGVSSGEFASLNLGYKKNDSAANVKANFERVFKAMGIERERAALASQVHGSRICIVDEAHTGRAVTGENGEPCFDGLATNRRGIALVTFYADCVPVFLYDARVKAIALAHSGWRGTVKRIAAGAVRTMAEAFGSRPSDIVAAIGPAIGGCCFEVGAEVDAEFEKAGFDMRRFSNREAGGRGYIDLRGIVSETLKEAGLTSGNICVSGLCTKCEDQLFFSYRRDKGKTGSMAAIMQLV